MVVLVLALSLGLLSLTGAAGSVPQLMRSCVDQPLVAAGAVYLSSPVRAYRAYLTSKQVREPAGSQLNDDHLACVQ